MSIHWSITWESLRTTDTSVESIVAENFITTTELHKQITTHRHGLRFWTATVICYQASPFALQGWVGGSPGKEVAQTGGVGLGQGWGWVDRGKHGRHGRCHETIVSYREKLRVHN